MVTKIRSFRGMLVECTNKEEHKPHVTDFYNTHQYGELEHFCPGIAGKKIKIKQLSYSHGTPKIPTNAKYEVTA